MVKLVCSVFDTKGSIFANPFTSVNQSTALRDFHRAASDPDTNISHYPADYVLFELGTFDDSLGTFSLHSQPVNLGPATQFQNSNQGGGE